MWPNWAKDFDWDQIEKIAIKHNLDPKLVGAVVKVESDGNTHACRYEPRFRYLLNTDYLSRAIGCTRSTMIYMQKTSWGLMQVMGAVAYEHGLMDESARRRRWPTALINPAMGLEYGCRHLKQKYLKYGPSPARVYASYNAGSIVIARDTGKYLNQDNVDRFLDIYRKI